MRIVLDTNALVAGIFEPHSPAGSLLDAVLTKSLAVLYDDRIVGEYRAVLGRPLFGLQSRDVDGFVDFIELNGELVMGRRIRAAAFEPGAVPFLEVAMSGRADTLITENVRRFKPTRGKHHVDVCSSTEFIRRFGRSRL